MQFNDARFVQLLDTISALSVQNRGYNGTLSELQERAADSQSSFF